MRQSDVFRHALLTRVAKALEMLNALCILIKSTHVHKLNLCFQTFQVNVQKLRLVTIRNPYSLSAGFISANIVTYLKGNYTHKRTTG